MLKKGAIIFVFVLFLSSLASAEIIVNNQPEQVYNLGDSLTVSMTAKSLTGLTGTFSMNLICEGNETNFYKNGLSLSPGQEQKLEASLIFNKALIGELKGNCLIKGILGEEYILTNEFTLSDKIVLSTETIENEFIPGESYSISGTAIKENGQNVNGFVKIDIISDNNKIIQNTGIIQEGIFSLDLIFPKDMKAGKYLMTINGYEEEFGNVQTNNGFLNYNVNLAQIPTSLEIVMDKELEPGVKGKIKVILHDQTGENIPAKIRIKIKNNKTRNIKDEEIFTNEDFLLPINYDEKPLTWSALAEYEELTTEKNFLISEKKKINISLLNNIVTITNVGNIPYKDSVEIKIGEEKILLDVDLGVDKSKQYTLKAPNGEYEISVLDEENQINQRVTLTGKVVSAKEKKKGARLIFSFAWIFILLILGFTTNILFKKGHNRTFLGRMPRISLKKDRRIKTSPDKTPSKLISRNPAFVSLSIAGEKQKAIVTSITIRNLKEIQETKGNARETLQKIIDFAEEHNAITYENGGNLYFILAPSKTKTFKNESTALHIAEATRKTLKEHNRLFKQKINFGISITSGMIVLKPERKSTKFMSLGTFITDAKKTANLSEEGEILLSGETTNKLRRELKVEKFKNQENVYAIQEIKKHTTENKKFVEDLVKKWEKEKKE